MAKKIQLTDRPNLNLRMRVKTPFGTNIDLEQKNIFVITKKITQKPKWN